MKNLFGRKLNRLAMYGAVFVAIALNSTGTALGWWPASMWAVVPLLGSGLGAGWLFGSRIERDAA